MTSLLTQKPTLPGTSTSSANLTNVHYTVQRFPGERGGDAPGGGGHRSAQASGVDQQCKEEFKKPKCRSSRAKVNGHRCLCKNRPQSGTCQDIVQN